jgi:hypothetical protein
MAFDLSVCCNLHYSKNSNCNLLVINYISWPQKATRKMQGKEHGKEKFEGFFLGDFARSTCCTNC